MEEIFKCLKCKEMILIAESWIDNEGKRKHFNCSDGKSLSFKHKKIKMNSKNSSLVTRKNNVIRKKKKKKLESL